MGESSTLLIAYSDFYIGRVRYSFTPGGTGIHSFKHVAFLVVLDLYYSTLKLSQDEAWEMVGEQTVRQRQAERKLLRSGAGMMS